MRLYVLLLVFLKCSIIASAQVSLELQEFYKEFKHRQLQQKNMHQESINIEGSPYENNEFIAGAVVTKSDVTYNNVPLRYNIYSNEMEFSTEEGDVLALAVPEIIDYILIEDYIYIYVPYGQGNRLLRSYFKVLTEGKFQLLLKQNILLREAVPVQAYKDAQPARFVKSQDEFFIRTAPAEARKVSNRRELLSVLTEKSNELNSYLKKNRVRFNRANDMIDLITFYNSLF